MIYSDKIRNLAEPNLEEFGLCSVGVAILGSAAIGAGATIYGASKGADAQRDAARMAVDAQTSMYMRQRNDLAPYMSAGAQSLEELQGRMPFLTSPIAPLDQEGLDRTPGYQFTRDQGLRATQNALTATGLGRSGAAVKGASRFATGLADQTYMNQASYTTNLELANRQNAYNRLMELVTRGQNAAAGVGSAGVATGQGISNNLIGAGNAQAGAYMAGANAIGNAGNQIGGYAMFQQMMNRGNNKTFYENDEVSPLDPIPWYQR